MTDRTDTLIVRDATGAYYLLPRELAEATRLPTDHIADAGAPPSGDTTGFLNLDVTERAGPLLEAQRRWLSGGAADQLLPAPLVNALQSYFQNYR